MEQRRSARRCSGDSTERFARWGLRESALTPCYGMAEASLAVTFKPAGTSFRTLGVDAEKLALDGVVEPGTKELVSVGRPLAGVEVEIRDAAGVSLSPGRVGHIFVRGSSVMAGYFDRTDLTDQAIHDGWLDTGDLGFTEGGELFVCGRHKDIIVVRGANHPPEEFEAALESLPGVRTGCAVAVGFVPPGEDDEALAMLVETTTDASSDAGGRGGFASPGAHADPARTRRAAGTGHAAAHQQREAATPRGPHPVAGRHADATQKGLGRKATRRRGPR